MVSRSADLRKVGPPGTAWCSGHQCFFPVASFSWSSSHWNGYDLYCKECHRIKNHSRKPGAQWRAPQMYDYYNFAEIEEIGILTSHVNIVYPGWDAKERSTV